MARCAHLLGSGGQLRLCRPLPRQWCTVVVRAKEIGLAFVWRRGGDARCRCKAPCIVAASQSHLCMPHTRQLAIVTSLCSFRTLVVLGMQATNAWVDIKQSLSSNPYRSALHNPLVSLYDDFMVTGVARSQGCSTGYRESTRSTTTCPESSFWSTSVHSQIFSIHSSATMPRPSLSLVSSPQ